MSHEAAPGLALTPVAQGTQSVLSAEGTKPAAHSVHAVSPVVDAIFPVAHASHGCDPASALAVPSGQSTTESPSPRVCPARTLHFPDAEATRLAAQFACTWRSSPTLLLPTSTVRTYAPCSCIVTVTANWPCPRSWVVNLAASAASVRSSSGSHRGFNVKLVWGWETGRLSTSHSCSPSTSSVDTVALTSPLLHSSARGGQVWRGAPSSGIQPDFEKTGGARTSICTNNSNLWSKLLSIGERMLRYTLAE
mmetsp:Transcript_23463/g.56498  ORF Transcript_23463/g.56498 Transcript_23463/m.56498 type:complete len:250 (+) Transcript_23463:172-921(+)